MFTYHNYNKFVGLITVLTIIATVQSKRVSSIADAQVYLSRYGYLPASTSNKENFISKKTWMQAVQGFQSFAGLNETGYLDQETMALMSLPRCGVQDKEGFTKVNRTKRYALQGSNWGSKSLTYKIINYPIYLQKYEVFDSIAKAFAVWSDYTDLTFTLMGSGPVDIAISFAAGEHGDDDPFDGEGGTLAHAFFPVFGGDAHFDAAEHWTIDSYEGSNLMQAAAHEFGHALGLRHSDKKEALMAPFYRGYVPNLELHADDIAGIQALYGPKSNNNGYPGDFVPPFYY